MNEKINECPQSPVSLSLLFLVPIYCAFHHLYKPPIRVFANFPYDVWLQQATHFHSQAWFLLPLFEQEAHGLSKNR